MRRFTWSIRAIGAIWEREVKAFFTSPIAYVVTALFFAVSAYFFAFILAYAQQPAQYGAQIGVNSVFQYFFSNVVVTLFFIGPLISMRLISEEKRSRTIELLMTSPVTEFQVIVGKYLGAITLFLIMLASIAIFPILGYVYGEPETGRLLAGYLGVFLLGASFVAIGVLTSTVTKNQIISAFVGFVLILVLWFIDGSGEFYGETGKKVMSYLALREHFTDFSKGIIDTKHIIYYLSVIVLSLFLSIRILETRTWRH